MTGISNSLPGGRDPEILADRGGTRRRAISRPGVLRDHQVLEGAWITVISGEVRITSHLGQTIDAEPGTLVQFAPQERHELMALVDSRILLLLTPWPGAGHPGAMTLVEKTEVREPAAARAG